MSRRDAEAPSPRRKPHVTRNDRNAPVQADTPAPDDVPVLPANASGQDTVEEQTRPTDEESMYGGRPAPESDRSGDR